MTPTRILLIDDHALFRKGLAQLLNGAEAGLVLAGDAADGSSGIARALELQPDLVLIDLHMKPMNGIETLRALKAAGVRARCIILTVSDDERDVLEAMRVGADGYLLKDMEPEELHVQLQRAAAGSVVLGSTVAGLLAHALSEQDSTPPRAEDIDFTDREREILGLLAAGRSNKEIARVLGISDATVKVHIKHVLRKLDVKSRLEAAVWALQNPRFRSATPG
ncbi:MAG: two-component system response regulator NarL [Proteobacteria bacterium]|nr:two-component system response regulator NarL [Pseudomonadota bacterium]